jgi:hypothetical protein
MKSPGQRRGTGEAGASIPRWRERGHSRICHPSMDDEVDGLGEHVMGPLRKCAEARLTILGGAKRGREPPWGTQELERSIEPER